jgi:hypothetical protein
MFGMVCVFGATALGCADLAPFGSDETVVELVGGDLEEGGSLASISGPLAAAAPTKLLCGKSTFLKYKPALQSAASGATKAEASKACISQLTGFAAGTVTCDTSCCVAPATCHATASLNGGGVTGCTSVKDKNGVVTWKCKCSATSIKAACTECDLPAPAKDAPKAIAGALPTEPVSMN